MTTRLAFLTAVGAVAVSCLNGAGQLRAATYYQATDLGTLPGGTFSYGSAINASGQVTGYCTIPGSGNHAFLYSGGAMTDLGTLPGFSNYTPTAINNNGDIVGYATAPGQIQDAFSYSHGVMTDLGTFGGKTAVATGINDSGDIVGSITDAFGSSSAFLYSNGQETVISGALTANGINASGQVTGRASDGYAYVYSIADGLQDLPHVGANSVGMAINNAGQVAGEVSFHNGPIEYYSYPFRYVNGAITYDQNSGEHNATGINASGQMIGAARFIYLENSWVGFSSLINPTSGVAYVQNLNGINDTSQTTGLAGHTNGGYLAFIASPIVSQTAAWTSAQNTNTWADSGNWSGPAPGATSGSSNTDTALFNQNASSAPVLIDAGRNLQYILFDTPNVNSMTIGTVNGPALVLSPQAWIRTASSVVSQQTINAPLTLTGDTAFTNFAASNSATLNFGGRITPAATSGTTTLYLTGSNGGANTISGILSDNGAGQLAVVKSNAGLWILSGANTYSGGTVVGYNGGPLEIAAPTKVSAGAIVSSPLGIGTLTLGNGATLQDDGSPRTLANNLVFTSGIVNFLSAGAGSITIDSSGVTAPATTVVLGYNTTLNVMNTTTINSNMSGGGYGFTKAGSGILRLGGANTYSVPTALSGGTLQIGSQTTLSGGYILSGPVGTGTLTLGSSVTLQDDGASRRLANNLVVNGNVNFSSAGAGSITFDPTGLVAPTTTVLNNNPTLNVTNTTTINSTISGDGQSLTKTGSGVLSLGGPNTYGGNTMLTSGILRLAGGSPNNIPASPTVNVGSATTLDVTGLQGATLELGSGSVAQTLTGRGNVSGSVTLDGGLANGSGNAPAGSAITGGTGSTLTIAGGLTLQNGSVSNFNLGAPNGSGHPLTAFANVTGAAVLTVNGSNTVNLSGTAQLGTYELYAFTSGAPAASQFSIGTNTAGSLNHAFSVTPNGEVDLVFFTPGNYWNFNGGGNYSDSSKWLPSVVPSGAGLTVTFGNGITNGPNGIPSVTVLVDGTEIAGSLVFNNTNGTGYILENDGVSGHGITLNKNGTGATISVTASSPQTIAANLTAADNVFVGVSSSSSLSITGKLNETGGSRTLTMNGLGTLTLGGANTYSGGTTINSGTLKTTAAGALGTGPLTINAAGNSSTLNLGANQTISSLTTNGTSSAAAVVSVGSGATLVSAGALTATGKLTVSGPGTTEIDGAPTLNATTAITVTNATLRFAATSGTATVGSGVTATVGIGGTLELAGSVSALSSGSNRVNINTLPAGHGILVSGTHQQVGNISGGGTTQVNAGSDFTANRIIQGVLIIGGASGNLGRVTIAASDASGNPLGQAPGILDVANSLAPSDPFGAGVNSGSLLGSVAGDDSSLFNAAPIGSPSDGQPVPEPSTMILLALAGLLGCSLLWHSRSLWHGRETSPQRRFDKRNDSFRKQLIRHDR